jgi:hypothetical protein
MKNATNMNQTIQYTTIVSLEPPTTMVATDEDGSKFEVPMWASVGDVMVCPEATAEPVFMTLDSFKVGRVL